MLESIYASKLYRSSARKDKIRSAIENPLNKELVSQLAEDLDKKYQNPTYLDKDGGKPDIKEDTNSQEGEEKDEGKEEILPSKSSGVSHSGGGAPKPSLHDSFKKAEGDMKDNSETRGDVLESKPNDTKPETNSKPEAEVKDSIQSENKTPVQASTATGGTEIEGTNIYPGVSDLHELVAQVKDTLNMKDDTKGVERTQIKKDDKELWIYYNDEINLNSIMSPVIESLNASGYSYLQFNRLARSDNAIVFEVNPLDTEAKMKPIQKELEDLNKNIQKLIKE